LEFHSQKVKFSEVGPEAWAGVQKGGGGESEAR